jgi:hypothetical protein
MLHNYISKICAEITTAKIYSPGNYFNPYPANVEYKVSSYNVSKWQMGFNSAFKGLKQQRSRKELLNYSSCHRISNMERS